MLKFNFYDAELIQPSGAKLTVNGIKYVSTREISDSGRSIAFVYEVDETPIIHAADIKAVMANPDVAPLQVIAVVFWDEIIALEAAGAAKRC